MIIVKAYDKGKLVASMPTEDVQSATRCTRSLIRLLGMSILTEWHRDGKDLEKWIGALTKGS